MTRSLPARPLPHSLGLTRADRRLLSYGSRRPVSVRLWLPLTPIVLLFAPLVLLASPLLDLTPARRRIRPIRAAWAMGALLLSLSGTCVEVDTPRATIRIRIF